LTLNKDKLFIVSFKKADLPQTFISDIDDDILVGDLVVGESERGITIGKVIKILSLEDIEKAGIKDLEKVSSIVRKATSEDQAIYEKNKRDAEEADRICLQKIKDFNLGMKLVRSEYMLDKKKIVFYFTSDGRVDFRELVKELAKEFKIRIEMRQIGVRDETKMIGCIGNCGRESCCSIFLYDFQPVSVKTAKDQNIVLNPSKISGVCGRLMCCLSFEHTNYLEKMEDKQIDLRKFETISDDELKKLEG